MSVKKYSKKKDGGKRITKNFQVKEFACNDGTDEILIDDETVTFVQCARSLTDGIIHITSGYRTPAYNKRVGGASNSYHTKGRACDTYSDIVSAETLAKIYDLCGATGVLWYQKQRFTHVDNREYKYIAKMEPCTSIKSFLTPTQVYRVQKYLNVVARYTKDENYKCGKADKVAGAKTHEAFRYFCMNAGEKRRKKMLKKIGVK